MDQTPTNESDTARRYAVALARFSTLDAQARGAFAHQRTLSDLVRDARELALQAEQAVQRIRNDPATRGSRLNRLHGWQAERRAELALSDARAWLEAVEAVRAEHEPECFRLGRLRDDCEPLVKRLREQLIMEEANAQG